MSSIAIIGASSQIAKDLILSFVKQGRTSLLLYARNLSDTAAWMKAQGVEDACSLHTYDRYGEVPHDVVINFVGVGDPRRAAEMGASIFGITSQFDDMILAGLEKHPQRRYLFLSSGAVYGNSFAEPVRDSTEAHISINQITPQEYYATAKLHAEVRHRALTNQAIVDLRVFNYFSRTQDLSARFFVTDLLRAIRTGETVRVTSDFMVRDYLHPADFHQLVERVLEAPPANTGIDCYTAAPVDKPALLQALNERFGLRYEIAPPSSGVAINATGAKPHYYSLSRKAEIFGYVPAYCSLSGVLEEAAALLA
ncbi:NAD-dependent epimerase/dehydratase family protein [Chromobacterium haemolyticum]|uniref:NAD-dependent epimerase/dehydratase family protein n=1 Tax=Chromobacterium TaxID=535 RepID=UPI0005B9B571|nr:NAD-dependent epimerase/dehydratase family protein [Chromobacterium haemolyticum]